MFGEVQMAFWVEAKLKLSKFIISNQHNRPDVKTFHHLLCGGPNNGFRAVARGHGPFGSIYGWQTNSMHIKSAKLKGSVSTDIGNMELWARGWRYFFSELTVSFKPHWKNLQFTVFWVPLGKICHNGLSAVPPTHFTTLQTKNVNHSNILSIISTNHFFINLFVSARGSLEQNHFQLLPTFCTAA